MKKLRCIKCGLYFKDRKDPNDTKTMAELCWNCRFCWQTIGFYLEAMANFDKVNRVVSIHIDDLKIRKKSRVCRSNPK